MKFPEKQTQEIAKIQTEMDCPKQFACCKSGSTSLCKAKYVVNTHLVECIEARSMHYLHKRGAVRRRRNTMQSEKD